jgi:hypothetical protein
MLLDSEKKKYYVFFCELGILPDWSRSNTVNSLNRFRIERLQLNKRPITNIFIRIICIAANVCNFFSRPPLFERLFHYILVMQRLTCTDSLRARPPSRLPSEQGNLAS